MGIVVMAVMMGGMALFGGYGWLKTRRAPAEPPAYAVSPSSGRRIAVSSSTPKAVLEGRTLFFETEEEQREFLRSGASGRME